MAGEATGDAGAEPTVKRNLDVEVNGKRFAVSMFVPESQLAPVAAGGGTAKARPKRGGSGSGAAAIAGSGKIAVPMQGTVVKVLVEAGQAVSKGDPVVVLEAMKMENNVTSDVDGTVTEVKAEAGQSVTAGEVVVVIESLRGLSPAPDGGVGSCHGRPPWWAGPRNRHGSSLA